MSSSAEWRKTSQRVAPAKVDEAQNDRYSIYPAFSLGHRKIGRGFDDLANKIAGKRIVVIDGFAGVLWDRFRDGLNAALKRSGIDADWIDASEALKTESDIRRVTDQFTGGDDPLFGTRCTLPLCEFFDPAVVTGVRDTRTAIGRQMRIVYGPGAALIEPAGSILLYIDVPKDEIQFRSRAGSVWNFGLAGPTTPKQMYKRFYFVDWPVLNGHKQQILAKIDIMIDGWRPDDPTFVSGEDLRAGLAEMSRTYFRVRPWFEPGPWGGHWIEENVPELPREVPNYAWSFELIVPENGVVFQSDGLRLEVSFDCLMFARGRDVLGDWADAFGTEFPIRFDWLDTMDGGNLSLQCHPRPDYIRRNFGETFTQDETYYMLDTKPGAHVYLGFRDGVNPGEFRAELEKSFRDAVPADVDKFVAIWPANKHDLFLIPNGTIHCSGKDSMVLEISATPYIFTFKMYDWMRLDLDGKPRPLNIARAFENLYFERQGERARQELISVPATLEEGPGWRIVHLPTHREHFYDIHRLEFEREIEVATNGSPHVLAVVEGGPVRLITQSGRTQRFQYAETFVIPAAASSYRLVSEGDAEAKVIKAFVRSNPA